MALPELRRSGWLSPEDHGDRRNNYAQVDCGFLELIAGIALQRLAGALLVLGGLPSAPGHSRPRTAAL